MFHGLNSILAGKVMVMSPFLVVAAALHFFAGTLMISRLAIHPISTTPLYSSTSHRIALYPKNPSSLLATHDPFAYFGACFHVYPDYMHIHAEHIHIYPHV